MRALTTLDRWTDRRTHTHRQTNTQKGRQADRQTPCMSMSPTTCWIMWIGNKYSNIDSIYDKKFNTCNIHSKIENVHLKLIWSLLWDKIMQKKTLHAGLLLKIKFGKIKPISTVFFTIRTCKNMSANWFHVWVSNY